AARTATRHTASARADGAAAGWVWTWSSPGRWRIDSADGDSVGTFARRPDSIDRCTHTAAALRHHAPGSKAPPAVLCAASRNLRPGTAFHEQPFSRPHAGGRCRTDQPHRHSGALRGCAGDGVGVLAHAVR